MTYKTPQFVHNHHLTLTQPTNYAKWTTIQAIGAIRVHVTRRSSILTTISQADAPLPPRWGLSNLRPERSTIYADMKRDVLIIRQPIVTGTSVIGLKYKDGVMLAADNLGTF